MYHTVKLDDPRGALTLFLQRPQVMEGGAPTHTRPAVGGAAGSGNSGVVDAY